MFKRKVMKLKVRRTLEQLIDVYLQVPTMSKENLNIQSIESTKSEYMIRGACLVLGFKEPTVQSDRVTIYDKNSNVLIDR